MSEKPSPRDQAIMLVQQHHGVVGYDAAAKLVDAVTAIVKGERPASAEPGLAATAPVVKPNEPAMTPVLKPFAPTVK